MFLREVITISVLASVFNAVLLGSILCFSWNYGVTGLSPLIPEIGLIQAILIKISFSAMTGKGLKFHADLNLR
jgi:hypothetical protein